MLYLESDIFALLCAGITNKIQMNNIEVAGCNVTKCKVVLEIH